MGSSVKSQVFSERAISSPFPLKKKKEEEIKKRKNQNEQPKYNYASNLSAFPSIEAVPKED